MAWLTEGGIDFSGVDFSRRSDTSRPIEGLLEWQPGAQQMAQAVALSGAGAKGSDADFMNRWGDSAAVPEAVGCGGLEGDELVSCVEAAGPSGDDLDDPDFMARLMVEGCGRGGFISCGRIFDRLQDAGRSCAEAAAEVEAIHPNIVCGCPGRDCSERIALTPDDRRGQQVDDFVASKTTAMAWARRKFLGVPAWGWGLGVVGALYWMRR